MVKSFVIREKILSWRPEEEWKHELVYDPKTSQGIKGHCDLAYHPKGHGDKLFSVWTSSWHKKVTGSLEVALTYCMTPKVTVTFVVSLIACDLTKSWVIRGRRDILYDPKGHRKHFGQFDLVSDLKNSRGH